MKKRISGACQVVICAVSLNGMAFAAVPYTFVAGQPALASQVNENFSDLDGRVTILEVEVDANFTDLDDRVSILDGSVISLGDRVSTLEATADSAIDFLEYTMPFSALGTPKNVVIMRVENTSADEILYVVQSRYQNDSEKVSVSGDPNIVPPLIASYALVATNLAGSNITLIRQTIETPDNELYLAWNTEESSYTTDGTNVKTLISDTSRTVSNCVGREVNVCLDTNILSGTYQSTSQRVFARQHLGQFVDPITGGQFSDVVVESRVDPSALEYLRVRARGIGEIFRRQGLDLHGPDVVGPGTLAQPIGPPDGVPDGGPDGIADVFFEWHAIYYRIGGTEVGSLVGTPFAAGGALEGVFF